MTGNTRVRELTPFRALRDFFDYIYGDVAGYVYAPTKSATDNSDWEMNWFRWPEQKQEMIRHFSTASNRELYYSPSLYRTNSISKDNWLGSSVLWAEMDYGVPNPVSLDESGIPSPSLRIRSSTEDHQHWYWKLEWFENDPEKLEILTKRIAYSVDADRSCWDYQQVLRPPATLHQESQRVVTVLEQTDARYGVEPFLALPEPPQGSHGGTEELGELPPIQEVISRYKWKKAAYDAFMQSMPANKKRTDTLCYLAYEMAEMQMTTPEMMSVLINCDDRWGHFKNRADRTEKLFGIIDRGRSKYPVISPEEAEDEVPIFGFQSLLELNVKIRWLVQGLVPEQTIVMTAGAPKIGKTQFNMRAGMNMAIGEDFLQWPVEEPITSVFFSMEMGMGELSSFARTMAQDMSPEQMRLLEKNFKLAPLGQAMLLNQPRNQAAMQRICAKYKPRVIFIDSFGVSVGDDLSSEKVILPTVDFLKKGIINEFGVTVWFVHHNRKAQIGNKQPKQLADLFGSQYIAGSITSGVGLWKDKPTQKHIEVNCIASRLAEDWDSFDIMRTPALNFELLSGDIVVERADNVEDINGRRKGGKRGANNNTTRISI